MMTLHPDTVIDLLEHDIAERHAALEQARLVRTHVARMPQHALRRRAGGLLVQTGAWLAGAPAPERDALGR